MLLPIPHVGCLLNVFSDASLTPHVQIWLPRRSQIRLFHTLQHYMRSQGRFTGMGKLQFYLGNVFVDSVPPLVRLANQEVLRWQLAMLEEIGGQVTHDQIKAYLWKTLNSGQVVPGYDVFDLDLIGHLPFFSYGHGVLRQSDPRFMALQAFCETRPDLMASPIIQLVRKVRICVF